MDCLVKIYGSSVGLGVPDWGAQASEAAAEPGEGGPQGVAALLGGTAAAYRCEPPSPAFEVPRLKA